MGFALGNATKFELLDTLWTQKGLFNYTICLTCVTVELCFEIRTIWMTSEEWWIWTAFIWISLYDYLNSLNRLSETQSKDCPRPLEHVIYNVLLPAYSRL